MIGDAASRRETLKALIEASMDAATHFGLRELAERSGISYDRLYAYRTGRRMPNDLVTLMSIVRALSEQWSKTGELIKNLASAAFEEVSAFRLQTEVNLQMPDTEVALRDMVQSVVEAIEQGAQAAGTERQ